MDLMSRLSDGYGKLFIFSGRATRAQFWTLYGTNVMIFIAGLFCAALLPGSLGTPVVIFGLVMVSFGTMAAAVRRLHDTNRSGFWALGLLIPLVQIVVVYFLACPSVSGPTRYDAHESGHRYPTIEKRKAGAAARLLGS
ncbi:MAG: DUF805 domain-containing protein [Pseudomonadota bacterium]